MIRSFFKFWSLRAEIRRSWEDLRRDLITEEDDERERLSSEPPPPVTRSVETAHP
jgi:hypothetical protein